MEIELANHRLTIETIERKMHLVTRKARVEYGYKKRLTVKLEKVRLPEKVESRQNG